VFGSAAVIAAARTSRRQLDRWGGRRGQQLLTRPGGSVKVRSPPTAPLHR